MNTLKTSVLALAALTVLVGCGGPAPLRIYRPAAGSSPAMTPEEARRFFKETMATILRDQAYVTAHCWGNRNGRMQSITLTPTAIEMTMQNIAYKSPEASPDMGPTCDAYVALKDLDPEQQVHLKGSWLHLADGKEILLMQGEYDPALIPRLVDALVVLKEEALHPTMAARDRARFAAAVADYRAAAVKPELPEDARRYKVRAESAVRAKDFVGAQDAYGDALEVAPWWPEGHFNRALVLSETGDYGAAIEEMNRYLALVPDAPNARAAQDKIYAWQGGHQ